MSELLPILTPNPQYSAEEEKRYREQFAPVAQKFRSGARYSLIAVGCSVLIILSAFLKPTISVGWFIGAVAVCLIFAVVVSVTHSRLLCPACHRNLDAFELGRFCPECGAADIRPAGWMSPPVCGTCGANLGRSVRSSTRNYKIHACTHCGLVLDDRGL